MSRATNEVGGEVSEDQQYANQAKWGRILVLLAAVLWSTGGLFGKAPVFHDWPVEHRGILMAFWRALFAGGLLLPFVSRPRWTVNLLPAAICFALVNVTYLTAMSLSTAANAIWLQNTAPIWVFLIGLLVLRTGYDRRDLFPLVFGTLGIAVILSMEIWHAQGNSMLGVGLGLLNGLLYALVILLFRSLRHENPVWVVAVNHLAAALFMLPYVLYLGVWPSPQQLLMLAAFGVLQMGIPYLLFLQGLRRISSQEASLIGLLEPVLLPFWVLVVLHNDEARWWTLVGGGLILFGLVGRYLVPSKRSEIARVPDQEGIEHTSVHVSSSPTPATQSAPQVAAPTE